MDELTAGFLRRQLRLHGRIMAVMAGGSLAFGLWTPRETLVPVAALLFLLAAWSVLGWAAADRTNGLMGPVLAAPTARRSWLVAYLMGASLLAGLIGFACLLPHGFRAALVAGLFALVYGWMLAALGLCVLLRMERPRDLHWIGGVALAAGVALSSPLSAAVGETYGVWHPLSLFKYGLSRALYSTGTASGAAPVAAGVWDLPLHGMAVPLLLSLFAWRWMLRSLDRMEALPIHQ
ncbi:MAG: hypothetical protein KY468_05200 [Armatimonadetes bacterium]|nr:hypothetical protein [Armatimonadota bacterium]